MKFDSVLFDFDGVIVDSEPTHHLAWSHVLARYGVGFPWEDYVAGCIGQSLPVIIHKLSEFSAGSMTVEMLWNEYPRKVEFYRARMLDALPVNAHTISLFGEISLPMAVVSSNAREEVEPVLIATNIRKHFAAVVFREDVSRHKPQPDPYLLAAEILKVQNPLVVEDSASLTASRSER